MPRITTPSSDCKIAAITMVRDDEFFLHKWVNHYGKQFGVENLFVFFDGSDQQVPSFCDGVNTRVVEKIGDTVLSSDKGRIRFLSSVASKLFTLGYDIVVGGDADEYLVVDPLAGMSLKEFLQDKKGYSTISGLGLDFGQKLDAESPLTISEPFLQQRKYAQIGTRYTKASVIYRPSEWGSGFHRVKGTNFHIAKQLYLMHFGYSDMKMIEGRLGNPDRLQQGWEHHVRKRSRTIRLVNSLPSRDFDSTVKWARTLESWCRPPYAWNKPGLLGMKVVVEIPERFRNCL